MKVLDRKLLREFNAQKGLILAITSLVAVGVMCFIYMRSAYNNLNLAKDQYYAQCRMADFWIDLKKVPLAELAAVAELDGVAEIRPRIQSYVTVDLERVASPLNGQVFSLPDVRSRSINDIMLKRGSYFTNRRANEVIVNDAFAREHKLYPGGRLALVLNNRREELLIVGTAISSEFVYLVGPGAITPDPKHFGVFYIKQSYAEEVFDFDGAANQVLGLMAPEFRGRDAELLERIERRLDPFGVFTVTPRRDQLSNRFLSDEIRGLGTFARIMPVIFLIVAALVLNVLMTRLIDQQRAIVGTLKGLGYSDLAVFWHFNKFGAVIGLVGGLCGCALGYGMAEFVTSIYRKFYEFPNLENRVYPGLYTLGLVISFGCAMIGSVQGARAALALRPAEAMRPRPPVAGGRVWLERLTAIWRRLSFGWRMALRNVIRHRLRTAVGVFAAAMGAGLLTTGFILLSATEYLIEFQFHKTLKSDADLSFKDERGADALEEARRLPGVDHAEPILDVACEFFHGPYHKKGAITGLVSTATLTVPRDIEGRAVPIPSAGLAMTRKLADLLHVSPGDLVWVEPIKGTRWRRAAPVVSITDSYLGLGVYAEIHYLSRLVEEELATSGVQLAVDPQPSARAALYRAVKRVPALQRFAERRDMIDNLNETVVAVQRIFIGLLVIFAGIIFFASLLNISLIALAERRREVATLRVQGYGDWQIGGYFLRESMLINVLGTALGLPLGYSLAWWLTLLYDTEMFRFPLVSPPSVWIMPCLLAACFGLVAHTFVQREINRLNWREALNVKE